MKPHKNIEKELQDVAPALARLDKINFYQVEESYFANFQSQIVSILHNDSSLVDALPAILSAIPKKELYPAPAPAYFKSMSDGLISKIHAEEVAEELSYTLPALQHIDKKELYPVPAAYFTSFPESIARLAADQSEAHTLPIAQWGSRWSILLEKLSGLIARPRYSFAIASFIGMIVCVGLVVNTQNNLSEDDRIFAQMQQLPDADLHHYIDKHRDEFDEHTILHNISNVDFTHDFDKPEQVTPHIEGHAAGKGDEDITSEDILD